MRGKHDRASELRAIADGRLLLNVRNGVTVSRLMLAKIADELEAERAAHAEARKALGMMLKEHDILSGNFGDVMDPKHKRPDRWPTAAGAARRVLEGGKADG